MNLTVVIQRVVVVEIEATLKVVTGYKTVVQESVVRDDLRILVETRIVDYGKLSRD